jgi:hypothetical protein
MLAQHQKIMKGKKYPYTCSDSQVHEVQNKTSPPTPLLSKERGDKAQLYRGEVKQNKTSPPTPLLSKERGDKAQLYRGEVKLYLARLGNAISVLGLSVSVVSGGINFFTNPTAAQASEVVTRPSIGTVKSMTNGDIMCYVNLVDNKGKMYKNIGASFEICAKEKTFLNKKVRLSYKKVSVNDCQSAEPCGKKRLETLITKMELIR